MRKILIFLFLLCNSTFAFADGHLTEDQKNKVIKLLKKEGFYINSTIKDLANNDRCIVCTKI